MKTKIAVQELRELGQTALIRANTPVEVAALVMDDLLENELTGYPSHGVLRLADYIGDIQSGVLNPAAIPTVSLIMPNIAIVDGCRAFGVLARQKLILILQKLALEHGIAIACLRDAHHLGRLAAIGRSLAGFNDHPLAVIGFSNYQGNGARVAPTGGHLARLCTNPLLLAFPTNTADPFVLDMSTSTVSEGFIRRHVQEEKPVPPGCLVDAEKNDILDPASLYDIPPRATIQPLGGNLAGHKGYGLAVAMELFCGALAGAGHVARPGTPGNGGLFLVIDPSRMPGGIDTIRSEAEAIMNYCRDSGRPEAPARMPGEGYSTRHNEAKNTITLSLPTSVLAEIRRLAGVIQKEV
ncbi:ureidoglycolate dehydrogenase [Xenorhabdus stockiae]|uniref:Ureidoglycolate dehydrogenase n=1 Tax=Xenorhabdus stockiae TaxID=351614 RepID=A0A2D0KRR3_9GAMM|nr:Ldh family oxidoreductase [Xenorhabdus stockiae]PHM66068.1 ureidoglycolate dehydrogenase [Xenorhabdus stockiae]